jgi:indole-3-glycerol phosphate synthase
MPYNLAPREKLWTISLLLVIEVPDKLDSILEKIIEAKKISLADQRRVLPLLRLREQAEAVPSPQGRFLKTLTGGGKVRVIGEIKKASPSKGVLCHDFRPLEIADLYRTSGVSALSVLTETDFFQGSNQILRTIVNRTDLPVLRKDFIIDEYQIIEARLLGASAYLLIADCLDNDQLASFIQAGEAFGLTALVEVHRPEEVERALLCNASLIGINNRNLRTFQTSLNTTFLLRRLIPDNIPVISESGIHQREDILRLQANNIQGALIGEAFMRKPSQIPELMKTLLSG